MASSRLQALLRRGDGNRTTSRVREARAPKAPVPAHVASQVESLVKQLTEALDIPGDSSEYVNICVDNIEPFTTTKLRTTTTKNKIKKRVPDGKRAKFEEQWTNLSGQHLSLFEPFAALLGSIVDDKALTALLVTAKGSPSISPTNAAMASPAPSISVSKDKQRKQPRPNQSSTAPTNTPPSMPTRRFRTPSAGTGRSVTVTPSTATKKENTSPRFKTLSSTLPASSSSERAKSLIPSESAKRSSRESAKRGSMATNALLSRFKDGDSGSSTPFYGKRDTSKMLLRPREDEDLLDLTYGSKVLLRAESGRFAVVNDDGRFDSHSMHALPFTIINARFPRDRNLVRFQDTVCLYNNDGLYLAADSSGAVSGRRTVMDTRIKWTICYANPNSTSQDEQSDIVGVTKIFDTIALKSCFGTFLSNNDEGEGNAKGKFLSKQQVWTLSKSPLPLCPAWVRQRPYALIRELALDVNSNIPSIPKEAAADLQSFLSLPHPVQEQLLLNDLLSVMMGIEGRWLLDSCREDGGLVPKFSVNTEIANRNRSLSAVFEAILPVANQYAYVNNYVQIHSRFEFGLVQHAFCAAIRTLLKQYLILVAQLEHQLRNRQLTALRAWYYIQPSMRTMTQLYKLCSSGAQGVTGGAMINTIYRSLEQAGDTQTRTLYQYLMSEACVPYFHMLENWIYGGLVDDPYIEFQIKSREDLTKEDLGEQFNDTYWDERYTVVKEKLPVFLSNFSDKILTTGKYLNVIRECGVHIHCPVQEKIVFTSNERELARVIETAYSFASRELLQLLMHDKQLLARLNSIKRYFLLHQGDFFTHFMDIASDELSKPLAVKHSAKLESLLELALRTSNAVTDPFKDDLTCRLQQYTLIQKLDILHSTADKGYAAVGAPDEKKQDLKRLEGFTLTYRVRWPLSLIISKKSLTKYQLIFRHLFYCKHVERQMTSTWINHQQFRQLDLPKQSFLASYALRNRMLHFLENFSYYMMVEVLEPNWHKLENKLRSVQTVDEVLRHHNDFLHCCLKECLLTSKDLHLLRKIMSTCLMFANNTESFTQSARVDVAQMDAVLSVKGKKMKAWEIRQAKLKVQSENIRRMVDMNDYATMVQRIGKHFDNHLGKFIQHLRVKSSQNYDHHLGNLHTRLDYNGFYSGYFAESKSKV